MSTDTPQPGTPERTEPQPPPPAAPETVSSPAVPDPTAETAPVTPEPPATSAEPEPEPVAEPPVAPAEPEPAPAPPAPAPTVVYVDPPARPKKRGTFGTGIAVVLLSTGIFTLLYAAATAALAVALRPERLTGFAEYLVSAPFLVPVAVFTGAHLILVLVANRAGWWMHVLGGFIVAVLVWVAFIGAALIAAGVVGGPEAQQQIVILQQTVNPLGIIAAVLAREIPIWVGGLVARRGRAQAARNAEAQAAYERDLAAHRETVAPRGAPQG